MAERKYSNNIGNSGKKKETYRIPDVMDYKKTSPSDLKKTVNSSGKNSGKKKNSSFNKMLVALFASMSVAGVLCIYLIMVTLGKKAQNTDMIPTVSEFVSMTMEQYISIDSESFSLVVGDKVSLSTSSYPEELRASAVWQTNAEDIVYVSDDGTVVALSPGIAAITVTSGEFSDAIAIEVSRSKEDTLTLGMPYFGMHTEIADNINGGKPDAVVPSNTGVNSIEPQQGTEAYSEPASQTETTANSPLATENPTNSGEQSTLSTLPATEPTAEYPTELPTAEQATTVAVGPTEAQSETLPVIITLPEEEINLSIDTDEMFGLLSSVGFSPYMSNVCTFSDENMYYGEVLVASDSVHIYIKNRNSDFDNAVMTALEYLLPTKSKRAWNTYLSATADKTMTLDGRKVRVVVGSDQAHTQIIVFNE